MRGAAVDVAAVEAAVLAHAGVTEAAALVRADDPEAPRLVAYVVAPGPARPTVSALRRTVAEHLPAALVPSAYVFLPGLPLDANGKVDRRALPAPSMERPEQDRHFVAPRDAVEARVALVWASVLGLDRVGIHDDFLDLGGDSLGAERIAARLQDVAGIDASAAEVLAAGTVAAIAAGAAARARRAV